MDDDSLPRSLVDDAGHRPRPGAPKVPPPVPSDDPDFFRRLSAALDQLVDDDRTTDAPPEVAITECAPPQLHALPSDDHGLAAPSTSGMIVKRAVSVAVFLSLAGLGAAAAVFVFHDRLSQVIVLWETVPPVPPRPALRMPIPAVAHPPPAGADLLQPDQPS